MFERFTKDARAAIVSAQEEARALGHGRIGPGHLLLGVATQSGAPGMTTLARLGATPEALRSALSAAGTPAAPFDEEDAEALRAFGIDLEAVRGQAEKVFGPGALDTPPPPPAEEGRGFLRGRKGGSPAARKPHIPFEREAKKALEQSLRAALERKDRSIGTEHVLLGVLDAGGGATADVLSRLGTDPATVRTGLLSDLDQAA
ncbi:Clp protease N-terminal domain-containing protein [Streptomyces griseocarneus]|uniref:Clp protease N-terminal domain-containing protein n=1 Tax=Streptomyces griseocarneus TaxID=51201 RepID=UPI00167C4F7D|nr:Clp protease N-terminal domain-containing protein [Streptomyces griseocarneus]MBZ6476404.1 peptidase [Streptomyces griseocarneus]GHG79128.1 putative ATP-dependent Clp protease [Streptomyces griseocarneus]